MIIQLRTAGRAIGGRLCRGCRIRGASPGLDRVVPCRRRLRWSLPRCGAPGGPVGDTVYFGFATVASRGYSRRREGRRIIVLKDDRGRKRGAAQQAAGFQAFKEKSPQSRFRHRGSPFCKGPSELKQASGHSLGNPISSFWATQKQGNNRTGICRRRSPIAHYPLGKYGAQES
jgi:hypothetical protein